MEPLTVAFILFGIAVLILAIDLLVPSGGILLVLSFLFACASILFAFRSSYTAGRWMLCAELAAVPVFAWIFIKVWPNTPLGRRVIIAPPDAKPFTWNTSKFVGRNGTASIDLQPNGQIEIDGHRYDATSRTGLVVAGTLVQVVDEEMGVLFVVPASTIRNETTPELSKPQSDRALPDEFRRQTVLDQTNQIASGLVDKPPAQKQPGSNLHELDAPANDIGIQSLD